MRMGKEGGSSRINAAAEHQPKSKHTSPHTAGVGSEKKADLKGAQGGNPTDHGNSLRAAVKHIASEHPHRHDDLGPHHSGKKMD